MAKKTITFNLSVASVENAIKELRAYKTDFEKKVDLLAKRLAEEGVRDAQVHIINLQAVDTGDLLNSMVSVRKGYAYYWVQTATQQSAYVEFGTGTKGSEHPYPYEFPNDLNLTWKGFQYTDYNSGQHIFTRWDGKVGWVFVGDDGKTHFTEGMPARPYMHDTFIDLLNKVDRIAKEVFG